MRSPFEDFSVVSGNDEAKSAIPYHARENSLPFSYGQIKTSTPLKNGGDGSRGRELFRTSPTVPTDINFNLNSDRNYAGGNKYNYSSSAKTITGNGTDVSGMNAQPARLTSPLLVRKTLNRSPTRNTTNTIANTYHYNYRYGSDNGSGNDSNVHNYNYNYNNFPSVGTSGLNGNINNHNSSSSTVRKTPTRLDFEELLRERREKVYNEYRSNTYDFQSSQERPLPQPPVRQISSDLAARNAIANGQSQFQSQSQNKSKYNFDFEFNLNLDDLPRRANTMDRSRSSLQQYRTRNIPVMPDTAPPIVERNYHTVAAYGNGKASSYGNNEYSNRNAAVTASLGGASGRNNDFIQPIYATTTKQVANSRKITNNSSSTMYRGITEPELSFTDYPSAALGMASSSATLVSRPETPAFPVTPRTPYGTNNGYNSSTTQLHNASSQRLDYISGQQPEVQNYTSETIYQTNYRPRLQSNMSLGNSAPQEVAAHLVKFAKDSSRFWYKPNLSREEAISLLLNADPGTFVVRDSTTYKNAYGLVLRVAQPPPGTSLGKRDELVRHFLIEPTTLGVRLKGCANEPVFTSLSALVYEHSINQLALPCLLRIPDHDLVPPLLEPTPAQKQLMTQGAACNVLWLFSCDTESLTGEEAIRKAIRQLYALKPLPKPTEVHFKVVQQGITLTDNTRKKFFRKHYAAEIISFCAIDPDHRLWTMQEGSENDTNSTVVGALKKNIFAFVARRSPSSKDNQCHVFCDLSIMQPASAIVSFVNKTLPTEKQNNYIL